MKLSLTGSNGFGGNSGMSDGGFIISNNVINIDKGCMKNTAAIIGKIIGASSNWCDANIGIKIGYGNTGSIN